MSQPRPPRIHDHTYERYVASGGFGDVFAYRDNLDRLVAVKVLRLSALSSRKLEEFRTEASLMASLQHDNVVRVNGFSTAPDGRPYISMEYCNDHLGDVAHGGTMAVHDALSHAVKIASAVDAAHGSGLYHRDIKPANVLVKSNGQPALTDFGIAGGRDVDAGQRGVSLQYGAPEVIDEETDGEVLADVYSLGATTFALLTGHSPVWDPYGDNDDSDIIERALRGVRPRTRRDDVPASLEGVLARALSVTPRNRHSSAMNFALALQEVERELGFERTKVPFVADTARSADTSPPRDGDDDTRIAVRRVDPTGAGSVPTNSRDVTAPPRPGRTDRRGGDHEPSLPTRDRGGDHTEVRSDRLPPADPRPDEEADADAVPEAPDRRRPLAVAASVAVLAAIAGAVVVLGGDGADEPVAPESDAVVQQPPDGGNLFAAPTRPTDVSVDDVGGQVVVTWAEAPDDGASYVVAVTDGPLAGESYTVDQPRLALDVSAGGDAVCVEVLGVLGSASSEPSREVCGP